MYTKVVNKFIPRVYSKKMALITALILLTVTVAFYVTVTSASRNEGYLKFASDTKPISEFVRTRMQLYSTLLYSVRGFFDASDDVRADEWTSFVNSLDLAKNYTGVTAMYYAPKTTIQKSVVPVFPVTNDAYVYPITYLEPYTTDRARGIGFNLGSEPNRLKALNVSLQTNESTITPLLKSVVTNADILAMFIPIFKKGMQHTTYEERVQAVQGFANVSFKISDVFNYFVTEAKFPENIGFRVYDTASVFDANDSTLLFDATDGDDVSHKMIRTDTIEVAGRTWLLMYSAKSSYDTPMKFKGLILVLGTAVSFLVPFSIYFHVEKRKVLKGSILTNKEN